MAAKNAPVKTNSRGILDGKVMGYDLWADGEPDLSEGKDCVLISRSLSWKAVTATCGEETKGSTLCQLDPNERILNPQH